jgi:hypothetical protein
MSLLRTRKTLAPPEPCSGFNASVPSCSAESQFQTPCGKMTLVYNEGSRSVTGGLNWKSGSTLTLTQANHTSMNTMSPRPKSSTSCGIRVRIFRDAMIHDKLWAKLRPGDISA